MIAALFLGYRRIWVWGYQLLEAEKDRDEWKALALSGMKTAADVAQIAARNAIFTPEQAETALRAVRGERR